MKNNCCYSPMKTLLLSSGVVSAAFMLKLSLPVILDFLAGELPLLWSLVLSWLQPPYLYLLVNCIILSIVASSKLQPRGRDSPDPAPEKFPVVEEREYVAVAPLEVVFGYVDGEKTAELSTVSVASGGMEERERVGGGGGECDGDTEFVVSRSRWTPPKREPPAECSSVSSGEKPSISARFTHRRFVKASPEGKTGLGVSRPKRQEMLESTWRTITEGRPMPLKRHLRKSDTFAGTGDASPVPVRVMKKSETFNGGNSSPGSGGSSARQRREPSLSQDELNRRVEAFIKKFNEEMRLQRQESLNHYTEMVGRGAR